MVTLLESKRIVPTSCQARICIDLYRISHEISDTLQDVILYIIFGEKYFTNTGRNFDRYKITQLLLTLSCDLTPLIMPLAVLNDLVRSYA